MSQSGKFFDGSAASDVEFLTGNTGGAVGADASQNINILGSGGVNVAGDAGTNTLTITVSGSGFAWNSVAGAAASLAVGNGYVPQNAGLTTFTLPITATFGTSIAISGFGAGGWTIAQNAGQNIIVAGVSSTVGAGGSVASSNRYDEIEILCVVADTTWKANSLIGTLTVT